MPTSLSRVHTSASPQTNKAIFCPIMGNLKATRAIQTSRYNARPCCIPSEELPIRERASIPAYGKFISETISGIASLLRTIAMISSNISTRTRSILLMLFLHTNGRLLEVMEELSTLASTTRSS